MMKDNFHIVLLSNSSMKVFPENTTTHFNTYLPQQMNLEGHWSVALTEIQIPYTFQHFSSESINRFCLLFTKIGSKDYLGEENTEKDNEVNGEFLDGYVKPGIYRSIRDLLSEINTLHSEHIKFDITLGGYVFVKSVCSCVDLHRIVMSDDLMQILGFGSKKFLDIHHENVFADFPANLNSILPNLLMVYTDILEHYVTGDVETPLLRTVPLSHEKKTYNSLSVKQFSPPMYLPILSPNFRSIEIDIRDQYGKPIPFNFGTLSVTLHFKKLF